MVSSREGLNAAVRCIWRVSCRLLVPGCHGKGFGNELDLNALFVPPSTISLPPLCVSLSPRVYLLSCLDLLLSSSTFQFRRARQTPGGGGGRGSRERRKEGVIFKEDLLLLQRVVGAGNVNIRAKARSVRPLEPACKGGGSSIYRVAFYAPFSFSCEK